MASTILLGRFYLAAQTFTVNATPLTTTAGYYYLAGYGGESPNQLDDHVGALIATVVPGAGIGIALDTGLVYIGLPGSATITWGTATTLRDLLGFAGDVSSTDLAISAAAARYIWIPRRSTTAVAVALYTQGIAPSTIWSRSSTSRVVVSPSGVISTVRGPYTGGECVLEWRYLSESSVLRAAATDPDVDTLEQLWLDVLRYGQRVRVIPDSSVYTSSATCVEAVVGSTDDVIGSFGAIATRCPDSPALWDVTLPLREYVP